ncbi:MAG: methionine gamma-lyase family protein [Oscillospiraceae bacterium]|nr:methionine gamma-lyase family protein [Oscillospiraceae bacterium]
MSSVFSFDDRLLAAAAAAEQAARPQFEEIDRISQHGTARVLKAFQSQQVSAACFAGANGYGYDDVGRDKLDRVWAEVFHTEDALVRHHFVSGTHALSTALFGVLRTGDKMVSVTGAPYDTLEEVIGIRGKGNGSLADYGITYGQVDLKVDGTPDFDAIPDAVRGAKVVYLQRSRGYSLRPALTIADIRRIAVLTRSVNPDAVIMVDNCYGEFVDYDEPTDAGADLIIGSLIKNPGGGIAETGGYIAGKAKLVEQCAYRLTCVGMGKEVGCSLNQCRSMYLGLFMAPEVVANARKTGAFAASLFRSLGFACLPEEGRTAGDIITVLALRSPEAMEAFCGGIQAGSPVDSFVTPEAWDMPGYESKVIMAAGTFTGGASIELSADGPMREPYAVYLQGGITYGSGKLGILTAAQRMLDRGLISFA